MSFIKNIDNRGEKTMTFFDDALNKTREAIDVVSKKTGEVVNVQKLKFEASSVESKRDKDFKKLGQLVFAQLRDSEALTAEMRGVIADINEKNQKINELEREIAKVQNRRLCPECNTVIGENALFCQNCGKKVVFDSTADCDEQA